MIIGRWTIGRHPSLPHFFCLERLTPDGGVERFANRVSDSPVIEAFASVEQARRIVDHLLQPSTSDEEV